ncbi:transposase family protein [Streptomyces cacaoi]|uniref:transposase family protein n=1 Tax=Streptomyces cacaoi TaxID=1898 RepID=UPI0037497A7C
MAPPHDVLACWFGVDRSTVTCAIGEVRPLPAQLGCTIRARGSACAPSRRSSSIWGRRGGCR